MPAASRLSRFAARVAALLCLLSLPALANHLAYPPSPLVKVAVNPITNKVYTVNEFSDSVTVTNGATGASSTIPVGPRPQFVVVNPVTNRVYVNNGGNATVSVIDGNTDTNITPTPLAMGSHGAMAVNPLTNTIYVVRQTGLGTDEVSFLDGNANTWYTIATESFQPIAVAVNPITDTLYVAHYGTGDVRIMSAANDGNAHPVTTSIGVWSHPMGIAVNPVTNKVYVVTEDSRGPLAIIDGATRSAVFPALAAGHGVGAKAVAVNTATNRVYAAYNGEIVVLDANTNALTYVPVPTGGGQVAIGINYTTNRIYVTTNNGVVSVIDGDTNAVLGTKPIAPGAGSIGVNSITNKVYAMGDSLTVVDGAPGTARANPLTTAISALPNDTSDGSATFTFTPSSGYSPNRMPVRGVYYQLDSTGGAWTAASGSGPYTASFGGLATGSHTIYAIAADGSDAPLSVSHQSNPLTGALAAYTFTVGTVARATPAVSLASSGNPSTQGQAVTFTAIVTGPSGTPTGSVDFRDGGGSIAGCSAVVLTNGSAACTTTALSVGNHTITATYSGNTAYTAATSGTVTQTVNVAVTTPSVALTSSLNPSATGQSVTFRAAVSGSSGTATGTVTFLDGGTAIAGCSGVALSSGAATCVTASLSAGSHSIAARYSGSSSYNAATSATLVQAVNGTKVTPSISLVSSQNPAPLGQTVVFTATLAGSAGEVTGTVAFRDGSSVIAGCEAVALSGGRAQCATAKLAKGGHSIVAAYSGSAAYNPVTSNPLKQNVKPK
jgi:DNA-binding beta-propeller fold protein YncE